MDIQHNDIESIEISDLEEVVHAPVSAAVLDFFTVIGVALTVVVVFP